MPAPRLSFRVAASSVELDEAGTVVAVVSDARVGESFLDRAGTVSVTLAGQGVVWADPELAVDADEVEVGLRSPDLTATVRHTFGPQWGMRLALANPGPDELVLDEVSLGFEPAYGWPAWALAAGAVGSYAVAHPDGRGPWLGGVLGLGALASVSATGLGLGRVVLAPGGRYVVAWTWSWYADPRAFAARPGGQRGDRQVPRSLHLTTGEATLISAGADEALVLPDRVTAEPVRDQVELVAYEAGSYPVELRTARGVTRYDLVWAEPVEELLGRVAADLLAGPRTPAGIVRLTGVEAALVVQLALRVGSDDAESAEEALDLFTARLGAPAVLDPRTAGFLCGEFDRTGDEELLHTATRIVLDTPAATPGLGLAAAQVGLARVLTGQSVDAVTAHLAALSARLVDPGSGSFARQTTALELALLGPRSGPARRLTDRLVALGAWLGGGLKGAPVRPRPAVEAAHLAAVLAALDEETSAALASRWACTAHELGRRTEAAVIAGLGGAENRPAEVGTAEVGAAHAWLAVAARTR